MKTVKYSTLQKLIDDCKKNGINLVKVMKWGDGIKVTACSIKSPVLREWKSKGRRFEKRISMESVTSRIEVEDLFGSEGEWTVEILKEIGL